MGKMQLNLKPFSLSILACLALSNELAQAQFFDYFRRGNPEPTYQDNYRDNRYYPNYQDRGQFDLRDEESEENADKSAISEFRRQAEVDFPIYILKNHWSEQDEVEFSNFVRTVGNGIKNKKCHTVKDCMRNPEVNPLAPTDDEGMILYSDCADWPYFLRSYFAAKKGLPFSFVTGVQISQQPYASPANRQEDLATARADNSPYGNLITSRGGSNVPSRPEAEKNYIKYLETLLDTISTRSMRVGPLSPTAELSDLYPVKMDRNGIGAGTVIHSTGHAGIVFDVDKSGTIHWCDAHPDGTVSYKIIKPSTMDRSRPDQGLGFFRFRNQYLIGANNDGGLLYGGRIRLETNQELINAGKYSLEQYYGIGSNVLPGQSIDPLLYQSAFRNVSFFDALTNQLRDSNYKASADTKVAELTDSLCTEMKQRVKDVEKAIEKQGPQMSHPNVLPSNIYSASGFWEDYSSPGRDSRMKASVADIANAAVLKFKQAKAGQNGLSYSGSAEDYQKSMVSLITKMNNSCSISYKKSNGASVKLNFSQILSRLNLLSFDPYHCSERRWGATGQELASCQDQDYNGEWYRAQQFMRNTVGKQTASEQLIIRSDREITLSMLQDRSLVDRDSSSQINLGTAKAPFMNLEAYFKSAQFLNALK